MRLKAAREAEKPKSHRDQERLTAAVTGISHPMAETHCLWLTVFPEGDAAFPLRLTALPSHTP